MRSILVAAVLLGSIGLAHATLRVFVTKSSDLYGLENHANHMVPTESIVYANEVNENAYDYIGEEGFGPLRPGTYPPDNAPSGTVDSPIAIPPGDWVYVWLQFQGETKGVAITSLQVATLEAGQTWDPNDPSPLPAGMQTTFCLCNNMGPYVWKRWDGTATAPDYPEWHNNQPQVCEVTGGYTYGLRNLAGDTPWNLYKGGAASHMALLGAIEAPADGRTYRIFIAQAGYASGSPNGLADGYFQFVPEPASILLLALAGLLIRRR